MIQFSLLHSSKQSSGLCKNLNKRQPILFSYDPNSWELLSYFDLKAVSSSFLLLSFLLFSGVRKINICNLNSFLGDIFQTHENSVHIPQTSVHSIISPKSWDPDPPTTPGTSKLPATIVKCSPQSWLGLARSVLDKCKYHLSCIEHYISINLTNK